VNRQTSESYTSLYEVQAALVDLREQRPHVRRHRGILDPLPHALRHFLPEVWIFASSASMKASLPSSLVIFRPAFSAIL
jgi:hypothetical protein